MNISRFVFDILIEIVVPIDDELLELHTDSTSGFHIFFRGISLMIF